MVYLSLELLSFIFLLKDMKDIILVIIVLLFFLKNIIRIFVV